VAEIAGLKLIVPSSVAGSGVSVSASGKVTFTAATSVSVNGVFDTTYDNYLIVCRATSSASTPLIDFRMRASGADETGSNYARQSLFAASTSVTGSRQTSQTTGRASVVDDQNMSGFHFYLYGPALAQPTATRGVNANGDSGAAIYDYASTHSLSTAYDGVSLIVNTGTWDGALTVYGLSQ
jgi:hypothetical protein